MARLTILEKSNRRELTIGLAAALLFGLGAPCAKLLLADVGAMALAGLLYLGAGLGLSLLLIARGSDTQVESGLQWRDGPLLAAVVVLGGIGGPVLMMMGLTHLSGVAGSLLLNLETPFTIMLALTLFGEHLSRAEAIGAMLIVGAAALLGGLGRNQHADAIGVLELAGACAAWAFDNKFTQRLSIRDPVAVAQIKTLAAGIVVTGLVLATGKKFPGPREIAAAMVLGLLSYGLSLVLYIRALRTLGAARQASLFATAPFAGALLAVPLLGERLTLPCLAAGLLMT
ncbi:MAG: DMT family transporter, partial [Candidatus Binataceae bacterium]